MFSKTHQRRNVIICLSLSCLMAALSRIRPLSDYFKALLSCFFLLKSSVVSMLPARDVFLIFSSFIFVLLDFQVLMKKIRSFAVRILQLTLNIR